MGEAARLLQRVGLTAPPALARRNAVPEAQRNIASAREVSPTRSNQALQRMLHTRALQARLTVSAPDDQYEREAEATADAVTRMQPREVSAPTGESPESSQQQAVAIGITPLVQRAAAAPAVVPPVDERKKIVEKKKEEEKKPNLVQKREAAPANGSAVPARVESGITSMSTGGDPLSTPVREHFESRFGYDFGGVRTHTGPEAANAAAALNAQAFTVGQHIFFASGRHQPGTAEGRHLLAHELTHTVQQSAGQTRAAPKRAQRRLSSVGPRVQRSLFGDAKDAVLAKVRGWALELPPYELLTVFLGRDPITDKTVERTPVNFVKAALKLVPDGDAIFKDLQESKSIEKTVAWFEQEIAKLDLSWNKIKELFATAWDKLNVTDLLDPFGAWAKVKGVFAPPLGRLANFALAVGAKIVEAIKQKVLGKLQAWAQTLPGYSVLKFVLGKDPFTDEPVERTAKNFVKAVLELVPGGDKIYENLEKTKTIEKTMAWLENEIRKLDLTWDKIKALFRKAWDVLSVKDLLNPLGIIDKMVEIFGGPAKRVIAFAIAVGKKVLEFIFEGAMFLAGPIGQQIVGLVRKIGDTFNKIVNDPVGFVKNLVEAVKRGFNQFVGNILEHLKTGLIGWLVGSLEGAGITLPEKWDLKGILSLVLQILGITYAKMRGKLVKVIGEEKVAMLEKIFEFIKLIATGGIAAAWQKIVESIGNLWDMVIGGIKDWAISKIVTAAVTKIVTMLNPAGAIIQAIIAIYNTIAFFVERIKQIVALVEAIVDSIANIAAGKLGPAANYVEKTLARTIPVILGFLARLIGLGDVSTSIKKVITTIQEKVDMAIDKAIAWVVEKAKSLFGGNKESKAQDGASEHDVKWKAAKAGVHAEVEKKQAGGVTPEELESSIPEWKKTYGFSTLRVVTEGPKWTIKGAMSAEDTVDTGGVPAELKTLEKGVRYVFTEAPEERKVGKFEKLDLLDKKQWRAFYFVTKRKYGKSGPVLESAPAFDKSNAPAFKQYGTPAPIPPTFSHTSGPGGRPVSAGARPLGAVTEYLAPEAVPFGGHRITGWKAGHLISGRIGGPGVKWNLAPIPQTVNSQMWVGHEQKIIKELGKNTDDDRVYYWYDSTVSYYTDSASKDIKNASDFVSSIDVKYGEAEYDETTKTFKELPGKFAPYGVRLPRTDEIKAPL